ncbi:hypothetical protein OIU78_004767 [Salix suchowensis]|nr:hypothetical protein OIU78_004767 [Salix suchowensis]
MTKLKKFMQNLLKPFKFNSSKERLGEDMEDIAAQERKQFSFDALGKLSDGREIAVKKLSHSSNQGKKEFMNEAKLLSRVQHRNVVNLLGYCAHGAEKLLVYEYVANESLDKLLFISVGFAFDQF